MPILFVPTSSTAGRLPRETRERKISESSGSTEFNEYVAQPLRELELILLKLKTQLVLCLVGILLTILGYLFIRYRSRCCEFPFQESSCAIKNSLPPMTTNYSTLAEEVDEFLAALQTKVSNLENAVQMPLITDRKNVFDVTQVEIRELIQEHSANLAAFGAIKSEDERMEELEVAVSDGYSVLGPFVFFGGIYLWILLVTVFGTKIFKRSYLAKLKELPEEDSENLQNVRLKKLKRRMPIFYLATLICIVVQLGLYITFIAGQYYAGSCPVYYRIETISQSSKAKGKTYLPKSFSDYPIFADEMQTALDACFRKFNKSMQFPILEVRQLGWDYEQDAIDRAFIHHMGLKQYHVDRNEMPRQLGHVSPAAEDLVFYFVFMCFCLVLFILPFVGMPMNQERQTLNPRILNSSVSTIPALKKLEILLQKLKIQFYFCFVGILLTILGYLAVWSVTECCEFPFQESRCAIKSSLPSMTTNHSTLVEEVDGFFTAIQAKVSILENAVEIPSPTDRQKTFDVTQEDIRELIQQHSVNLAAFGAIKREDERMEELEEAVSDGYPIFILFTFISACYIFAICVSIEDETDTPSQSCFPRLPGLSVEERENSQNSRLKKLKRQIPILYLATILCIIIGFGLYAAFLVGQYYVGSCPVYGFLEHHRRYEMEKGRQYLVKSFTDYPTFADELKSFLNAHLATLNKSIKFPTLENRQLGWIYDKHAIDAALKHHLELKQYHVDRTTMPRQISHAPNNLWIFIGLAICLIFNVVTTGAWTTLEGSVWHPCQFIKYYRS
ncbi:hypothetical protein Ddc_10205 [Ditylenchus destructor]|nr:hypothetical protein Ddc_10205 [Ditylenchus destructor]